MSSYAGDHAGDPDYTYTGTGWVYIGQQNRAPWGPGTNYPSRDQWEKAQRPEVPMQVGKVLDERPRFWKKRHHKHSWISPSKYFNFYRSFPYISAYYKPVV